VNFAYLLPKIGEAFFFFVPAFIGNCTPIIFGKLKPFSNWNAPMDFYKTFRGKRILGSHKTIRGFIVGPLFALFAGLVQYYLVKNSIVNIDYNVYQSLTPTLILSFLMGFGALIGDSTKSFFKRQSNVAPGKPWIPFDLIDFTLGSAALSFWFFYPGLTIYIIGIIFNPIYSLISNAFSKLVGLKKTWI